MAEHAPKVFISYAREDETIARRIFHDLKALGAEPWMDKESLLPGQKWRDEIGDAIGGSDFFLALLSNTSLGKRGYVQREIREAFEVLDQIPEDKIFLLPVRLDDCKPEYDKIKELHWVDLFPAYEPGFEKIVRVVRPPKMTDVAAPVRVEDEADLARTGWGLILPENADPAVREALQPLLDLRHEQASFRNERLYREFSGDTAYRSGNTYLKFLTQNGVGPGAPDPGRVPSNLLIAASPEEVPFEFQYDLAIQYRVGRLHFDSAEGYRNYADSIVSNEREQRRGAKRMTFFGTRHAGDSATQLAEKQLSDPLYDSVVAAFPNWTVERIAGEQATRQAFLDLLSKRMDFLLSVSHGMQYAEGHPSRLARQGALICSDFTGSPAKVLDAHCLSAADIDPTLDLRGLRLMLFSAYGGGTSAEDDFSGSGTRSRPFVSALAKTLLGRPRGAAAILAHVGNIWSYSFTWSGAGPQIQTIVNAVGDLLSGKPVGLAHRHFSARYAELAANYSSVLAQADRSRPWVEQLRIAMLDARNYIVLGDPAARIAV